MRALKQSAPLVIACMLAATCNVALAGNVSAPGSALDPYNYVAPPVSKNKAIKPAGEPVQEETQSTTTFVTMPGFETPANTAKAVKPAGGDGGLLSGVNDKFKSAGSGVVSGTKAASDQVVKGTKAVGGGIASGAKASGNFFMKGARAIGSGTKKAGSKVAVIPKAIGQGAKAAGENIKDGTHAVADRLPFIGKPGSKSEAKFETKSVAQQNELKSDEVNLVTKPIEDLKPAVADANPEAQPAAQPAEVKQETTVATVKAENKVVAKHGIMGKTFGTIGKLNKLNVFGHKKNAINAPVATAGKAPSDADKVQ